MDFVEKETNPNPVKHANIISRGLFLWVFPLFLKGYRTDLGINDLYDARQSDVSSTLGDKLELAWNKELEKAKLKPNSKPKMLKALWSVFGAHYAAIFILYFMTECIFKVTQTLFVRELVKSFSDESDLSKATQYWLAGGVIVNTLLVTAFFHPSFHGSFVTAMRCRISCSSLIYRKALRLSKSAQRQTTVGQLVNILANDCNRFEYNLLFFPNFFTSPIQLGIFAYFLWTEFGASSLAGIAFVLIMTLIQYWNGKLSTKYRRQIATRTDERGRAMNEIIMAIRVIKMYAWEKPFNVLINKLRKLEMHAIRSRSYLRGLYLAVFSTSSKLVPFLTFLLFVLSDERLTVDKVFFTVAAYNVIVQSMMYSIPIAASGAGEIFISLKRLEEFLLLEEIADIKSKHFTKTDNITKTSGEDLDAAQSSGPRVSLQSTTASWTGEKKHLNKMTFDVQGDKVVVIVGPVGSGKTTLLHALLGELAITEGDCSINGRISYACQEPWIFSGNVQQNILFGRPYDEDRYYKAVEAAALSDDFKQLAHGDMTVVGDRGVSLSGGQKARVNLARALYQPADIYLLDDPLSAVDTKVSKHLFEKCLKQHLKGHLRILVTHQLQYLPQADHVIVLNDGSILDQGTFTELVDKGIDFVSLLATESEEDAKERKVSVIKADEEKATRPAANEKQEGQVEKMVQGSLNSQVYWKYFKKGNSNFGLFLLMFVCISSQLAISGTEVWMSIWTSAEEKHDKTGDDADDDYLGQTLYLSIYGGLVALVLGLNFLRAVGWFTYSALISHNLHKDMFSSIVRAPTKFFDENPPGRVMNRFVRDLNSIDEIMPPIFFETSIIFLQMIGVLGIVIWSNWVIAIPAVFVLIVLAVMRGFYVNTAQDIKRIEGMTKSPVFTHAAASFQGLTSIRAAEAENILIGQFDGSQDIHTAAWFLFLSTTRCFGIWVELVSVVFLAIVTFSFLVVQNSASSSNVGLAITAAMNLTVWFQFAMRQSAEVANLMTSVERALEYVDLPAEAALESTKDKKVPQDWPKNGEILFKDLTLTYNEKAVLRNLNFSIKAKEKIGIVGRTGAGKSSIIQALFRMTEPLGEIYIDGICINHIGLHDLRKNISIIPQDPVLFCGTMRYNLDPFDQFEDAEIWRVLEEVGLKDSVPHLTFLVSDGGDNFSVGQKQLVCLARAILRNNRIIIMDEATANVDPRTDNFIQATIRNRFAECSIITIAHRLNSVMDCDRILVLDAGVILEYDHPWNLVQNEKGSLTALINSTGKSSSIILKALAEESYRKRRS